MAHRPIHSLCRLVLAGAAALALNSVAHGADFTWTDDDWSGGNYVVASSMDAEVHPGLLILEQQLDDIRFLASPIDYQGLYSMVVFHDSLFITCSDYPYMYDGAAALTYDYLTGDYAVAYEPYESGLHMIKQFGDSLYLPGPDSMDPWTEEGSVYMYTGSEWQEKDSLPTAIHVNDVEIVDGVMFATTGHWTGEIQGYGCVWMSRDYGDTFERVLDLPPDPGHGIRRMFGLGSLEGRLFAQPDGHPPEDEEIYSTTNGVDWDTLPIPGMPVDAQATFTAWGDSLLMTMTNRMYIWDGHAWSNNYWLPFNQGRWCRGLHEHKGVLYGGGNTCIVHRWLGGSNWGVTAEMGLNPGSEEIESIVTYFGRIYVSTSRSDPVDRGRLYVSAAAPGGRLISLAHDFGVPTGNAVIAWDGFYPGEGNSARLQIRSGATLGEMNTSPFLGPDGSPQSYYEEPGNALPMDHHGHRYFQYAAELLCPEGLEMPFLDSVTLEADSLELAAVAEPERRSSILLSLPQPNPAMNAVRLQLTRGGSERRLEIRVHDLQGRVIRTAEARFDGRGRAQWSWKLRDDRGRRVPSGIYRVTVNAEGCARSLAVRPVSVLR